jgi:hypothetical protein
MAMFQIIVEILGICLAILYVGFLAYSIGAVPLWVIVAGTFALTIAALVGESRDAIRTRSRRKRP